MKITTFTMVMAFASALLAQQPGTARGARASAAYLSVVEISP